MQPQIYSLLFLFVFGRLMCFRPRRSLKSWMQWVAQILEHQYYGVLYLCLCLACICRVPVVHPNHPCVPVSPADAVLHACPVHTVPAGLSHPGWDRSLHEKAGCAGEAKLTNQSHTQTEKMHIHDSFVSAFLLSIPPNNIPPSPSLTLTKYWSLVDGCWRFKTRKRKVKGARCRMLWAAVCERTF